VQGSLRAKQLVLGDPKDKSIPYNWSWVQENLPGDADYNPIIPWVSKVRPDRPIASDLHIYVDDCQNTAACQELAWQAASQNMFMVGAPGCSQKTKGTQYYGAWAGAVIVSDDKGVYKLVVDARWEKMCYKMR
jgi:hypothetical protein